MQMNVGRTMEKAPARTATAPALTQSIAREGCEVRGFRRRTSSAYFFIHSGSCESWSSLMSVMSVPSLSWSWSSVTTAPFSPKPRKPP